MLFADMPPPGAWDRLREPNIWPLLIALVMLAVGVWWIFGRRKPFTIDLRADGITFVGPLSVEAMQAIRTFFEREFPGRAGFQLYGSGGNGQSLRLHFDGAITTDEQERIRTFLVELLRG